MAIGRVRTIFSGPAGSPWLGTAYFDAGVPTDAQLWVDAVGAFWGAIDTFMVDDVTWATEADVLIINEVNGDAVGVQATTPATGTGTQGGEIAPTLLQGLLSWSTGSFVDGREVKGRWFIPGFAELMLTNGVLDASGVTGLNVAADTYIVTPGYSPVVWQRPRPAEDPPNPDLPQRDGSMHPIVSGSATNRFSPLRTRRD